MGNQLSRSISRSFSSRRRSPQPPARTNSTPNPQNSPSNPSNSSSAVDLASYEAACRSDPDLQSFDSNLQLRTSRAINSIAVGSEIRALSLDSLRDVTETLLEMNQGVVKIILQNKRDVWKNQELSDLVDDYFDNSLLTLDFCTALDNCLKRAGHLESIVNVAIQKFQEEHCGGGGGGDYSKTLEELRSFRGAGDPFTVEFFNVFNSVYAKQVLMLERLQVKKRKLDKKLGRLKAWRKVSNVIFVVAFASVLICSVVAAAVTAPPVVTALAAAAAVPLGSMGRWLNSMWKSCEKELMGQREIISSMQIGSYIVIKDLDSIRVLVERFQIKIEALLGNAEFAARDEEAVVIAVEEIKKNVDDFVKTIHDLSEHANKCTQETRMARTLILRRIINHPSGSNHDMGKFGEALEIFDKMQDASVQPDKATCNILMEIGCRTGETWAMMKILQYMKDNFLVLRYPVYLKALEAFKIAGESDMLLRQVNQHFNEEDTETDDKISPDNEPSSDNGLVLSLISKHNLVAVDSLLTDMLSKCISLESMVISKVVEVNCTHHRHSGALLAYEYSMKLGINLDRTAYLSLIGLSIRTNSFAMVLEIVEEMVKQGHSLGTYLNSLLIYRLGCNRETISAAKVFNLLPDEEKSVTEYTALIAAYFSSGNVDKGLETFKFMKSEGVNVALGTYCVLVAGLENCGKVREMEYYLKEKKRMRSRSCSQVLSVEETICNLLFSGDPIVRQAR